MGEKPMPFLKQVMTLQRAFIPMRVNAESESALETELDQRFPKADINPKSPAVKAKDALDKWLELATRLIEHPSAEDWQLSTKLPIDIRGTAFQEQVWQVLRQIPIGQTQSYKELAVAIGKPKASRAIAQACAANPLAVVLPCHRVVASSGKMSGYRWGVERKSALLEREAKPKK